MNGTWSKCVSVVTDFDASGLCGFSVMSITVNSEINVFFIGALFDKICRDSCIEDVSKKAGCMCG